MTTIARKKNEAYRASQKRSSTAFAKKVANLTTKQKTALLIKAGVMTPQGHLTAHYAA